MTLDDYRNIATVVAALVAIIGVVPLFRNLAASERSLRSRVYFDTLAVLEGKDGDVRKLRHILEDALKAANASGKPFDITAASSDMQTKLDQLAREYDKVGLLVKHGAVPTDFLFDFYSRPIVLAWKSISPLVNKERVDRNQKNHMAKFEILAIGAALYRQKKYIEEPPFPISAEDRRAWNQWKRWRVGGLREKFSV